MDKYTHEEHTFIEMPGFGRERFDVWKVHMLARMLKVSMLFCNCLQQGHDCHEKTFNLLSQGL